jgi:lincosamide nucleotidyltransferase B/F
MDVPNAGITMIRQILVAAERDPRIVGVVDYGSGSEGRMDAWSNVDAALFVRDADLDAFTRDWKAWAAQFGRLLLAYIGGVGHPWMVYDTRPMPLRVDFAFHPESALDTILAWPNAPTSAAEMVLYDATGGRLTANARRLVGQSLRPPDLARVFEQVGGDFWYYMLRTFSKLQRGQNWAARYDFNQIVLGNLLALLRLEAGAVDR